MSRTRRVLVGILVGSGLAACKSTPPPLPPIPASSGQVMLKAGAAPPLHDGETVVERVVAIVNGEAIAMSELEEEIAFSRRDTRNTAPPTAQELEEMQKTALERLVNHRLQVQEARKEKIEVTDDDIRPMMDDFIKRNGGDRDKFEAQLKAQGLSWEAIRRQFREQALAQRIRSRRVTRRATITESEVDAYMAENRSKLEAGLKYHARHIAILAEPPESPEAWDKAKAEIDEIVRQLQGGADFATLARERSKDASAAAGGDLGWLSRGELEPLFEDVILKVPKGGVTPPIKSAAGYHVFKVEEREDLTAEMLADARQQARDILLQKKAQERLDEWIEELRRRALITIRL